MVTRVRDPVCDPALEAALAPVLVLSHPDIRDKPGEADILLVAPSDLFLSRAEAINVLQSGHSVWMFLSEGLFIR